MQKILIFLIFGLVSCKTIRKQNLSVNETQPQQNAPAIERLEAGDFLNHSQTKPVKKGVLFSIESKLQIADLAFDETSDSMYLANLSGGIQLSKDQGQTWASLGGGDRCTQVLPLAGKAVFAICDHQLLMRALDAKQWSKWHAPLGPKDQVIPDQISLSLARPDRLYIGGVGAPDHNGLFFTDDQGKTWTGIASVTVLDDDGTSRRLTAVDEVVLGFAVHPTQPDLVVAAFNYGVFVSIDAGKNFVIAGLLDKSLPIPAHQEPKSNLFRNSRVQFDAVDLQTVYALTEKSFDVSRDAGVSWQVYPLADPLHVFAVHPSQAGALYAQSKSGVLLVSTNFGQTWAPIGLVDVADSKERFFNNWNTSPPVNANAWLKLEHSLLVSPKTGWVFGASQKGYGILVGVD